MANDPGRISLKRCRSATARCRSATQRARRGLVKMNAQQPQGGTDLVPTTIIDHDPVTGHFLPGNRLGLKRSGSLNKITKMMREQLAQRLEEAGPKGNPLLAMHDIMVDLELPAALRLQAAFRLAQFLA